MTSEHWAPVTRYRIVGWALIAWCVGSLPLGLLAYPVYFKQHEVPPLWRLETISYALLYTYALWLVRDLLRTRLAFHGADAVLPTAIAIFLVTCARSLFSLDFSASEPTMASHVLSAISSTVWFVLGVTLLRARAGLVSLINLYAYALLVSSTCRLIATIAPMAQSPVTWLLSTLAGLAPSLAEPFLVALLLIRSGSKPESQTAPLEQAANHRVLPV